MSFYALQQVDKASYDRLARNYFTFIACANDPNKEPVQVFSPLPEKMIGELELIREVSRDLQEKKKAEIARQKADAEKTDTEKKEGEGEAESKPEEDDVTEKDDKSEDAQEKKGE